MEPKTEEDKQHCRRLKEQFGNIRKQFCYLFLLIRRHYKLLFRALRIDYDDVSMKVTGGIIILHNITVRMEAEMSVLLREKVEDVIEYVIYKE